MNTTPKVICNLGWFPERPKAEPKVDSQSDGWPSLDCGIEEFRKFYNTLKVGERVVERGVSCMTDETGTIVETDHGIGVRWDTKFKEGTGMVTSVTGGTRRLTEEANAKNETRKGENNG